jgi:DNA-binding CsgD family transcriptional regulator
MAFVGRGDELARSASLLDWLDSGRSGALLVSGQPGIGKTRLLGEIERLARERGDLTAHTVCLPLTTVLPFDPVLDLLRGLRRALPSGLVHAGGKAPSSAGGDGMSLPGPRAAATDVFPWVLASIEEAAASGVVVFFVDDLHWSDRASLELIYYCGARLADLPVGWVLAARPSETLRRDLAGLARLDWFDRIDLRGLSREEVGRLVAAAGGNLSEPVQVADAVYARSAGNPFFCAELLTALRQIGDAPSGTGLAGDIAALLPGTVTESVTDRLAGLDELPLSLLRWMAVAPEPVAEELVARLFAGPSDPALAAAGPAEHLDRLTAAGFLASAGPGRWGFLHAIIRDAVYELIPPATRIAMHSVVADALPAEAAADRAPQLTAAGRFGDAAVAYLELGEAALARGRGEDAGALFAKVQQLGPADSEVTWRARAGEVLALVSAARTGEARELARPLFAEMSGNLRLVLMARYALALTDASELDAARDVAGQLAALDPGADPRAAAEAALARAFVLTMAGDPASALPIAEQAVTAAHTSGDPVLELRARNRLGLAAGLARDSRAGRDLLEPVAAEAEDRALAAEAAVAWLNLSFFAEMDGDAAGMEWAAARGLQLRGVPPVTEVILRGNLSVARMLQGDFDEALAHSLTAVRAAAPLGPATQDRASISLAHVHIRRGELAAARRLLDQLQPAVPGSFDHRRTLEARALLLEEEGDLTAAMAAYREGARDDTHPSATWCLAGQARLAGGAGEATAVAECLPRLQALAACWPHAGWLLEQSRGWLAASTGQRAEAIEQFRKASRGGDAFEAARCQLEAARLDDDGQAALAVVRRLESMGARRAADRARAAARGLGARPGRPHVRRGPLSEREFEVALLVAAGHTNADIASALYLSPRTVERHIGNILDKLGFRSRVQIAAHVAAGGLPGLQPTATNSSVPARPSPAGGTAAPAPR